jgi:hypothetical protein
MEVVRCRSDKPRLNIVEYISYNRIAAVNEGSGLIHGILELFDRCDLLLFDLFYYTLLRLGRVR